MDKTDKLAPPLAARRGFLQTAGSAGLLGAALSLLPRAASASASAAPLPAPDDGDGQHSGYRETAHIRKYYSKLRQL
jgi:hypothetical protein